MAVPTYTTDLTDIDDGSGTFTEPTGALQGTLSLVDTDNFIQGTNAVTKTWGNSGAPNLAGIGILDGTAHTISSPNAFYCWVFVGAGALIDTYANGGIRLIIGNTSANYRYWYVDGSEYFPYIGWQCIAVETDNAVVAEDGSQGTPSATKQYFGAVFRGLVNIGKGNPFGLDAIRYGRGELRCTDGDVTNGYASFGGSSPDTGAAAWDNTVARRYGMLTPRNGAFFMQGLFIMGLAGTSVDFRDSNRIIFIQNTKKVASAFNGFEVRHADSNVEWTNISVQALGTVSRGYFLVTAGTVTLDTCTFTDMDTFTFLASTTALNCTFRRTNAITAPGSDMTGSTVATPTVAANTSALIWNVATDPNGLLDNMTFSKGTNAHHAIEFGTTSLTSMTLTGIDFSGFSASQNNDASIFHIKRTSGAETVTINLIGSPPPTGGTTPVPQSIEEQDKIFTAKFCVDERICPAPELVILI